MSRTQKGAHRCPSGRRCSTCGPLASATARTARQAPLPPAPDETPIDVDRELEIIQAMKRADAQDLAEARGEPFECTCQPIEMEAE